MCGEPKPVMYKLIASPEIMEDEIRTNTKWICSGCKFVNLATSQNCLVCNLQNQKAVEFQNACILNKDSSVNKCPMRSGRTNLSRMRSVSSSHLEVKVNSNVNAPNRSLKNVTNTIPTSAPLVPVKRKTTKFREVNISLPY